MRELRERLAPLGLVATSDDVETFGDGTLAIVEAFQQTRGLPLTGNVDSTTWERLIEAGWRLGNRLLFLTQPAQRGDDVADLQVRLAQFGFNPGRIDGIFGSHTEAALSDFQRNCAMEVSGTLTRSTLTELVRMTSPRHTQRSLVTEARDLAGFHDTPTGPLVLCGDSPLLHLLVEACAGAMSVTVLDDDTPDVVAAYANNHAASFVISLQTLKHINGVNLHYWASYRSHSRRGEELASQIASACAKSQHLPRVEVSGMALPILRETKMITLHIEHDDSPEETLRALARVITGILLEVIHRQS
ncbi:MAG: peptidoglycan-binding domain-containing protein [Acidimicrobiales bacterium]